MLNRYVGATTARRAALLWSSLSRAGHHHSYELALTAGELNRLRIEIRQVLPLLEPHPKLISAPQWPSEQPRPGAAR